MKKKLIWALAATLACGTLTSCSNDDAPVVNPPVEEDVALSSVKPDYLVAGDKVALISPSYFTPMENVEKTAIGDCLGFLLGFTTIGESAV